MAKAIPDGVHDLDCLRDDLRAYAVTRQNRYRKVHCLLPLMRFISAWAHGILYAN